MGFLFFDLILFFPEGEPYNCSGPMGVHMVHMGKQERNESWKRGQSIDEDLTPVVLIMSHKFHHIKLGHEDKNIILTF